jgi:hypothetical protein
MRGSTCRKAAVFIAALLAAPTLMPAATALASPAQASPAATSSAASKWSIQHSPDVTIPNSQIESVSCSSATDCTAVGQYSNAQGQSVALAESWDGTTWRQQPTPGLTLGMPTLLGVSCPTADFCEAVGAGVGRDGARGLPVAEVWNGTSWTQQAVPVPYKASTNTVLQGVSCSSPDFCEAAGSYQNEYTDVVGFADIWNGTSWRVQAVPSPSGSYSEQLDAVSCPSATFCQAVGTGSTAYADTWNGTSWTLTDLPAAADQAISCLSATFCEAVGDVDAVVWNGATWTTQPVSAPTGGNGVTLRAVSCVTDAFCEAAGAYYNSAGTQLTLAEAWRGTSWTGQRPASPVGAADLELNGISCTATTACAAVGSFVAGQSGEPEGLADGWNGTSWKAERVARLQGPLGNGLTAVSCVSPDQCEAVGSRSALGNTTVSLAEMWNGTSWKMQPSAVPAGGATGYLSGVSCVSADFCEAVGGAASAAELWNGTSWSTQLIPGSATSSYTSVACTSADFCVAVGGAAQIAVWNGTSWSAQDGATGFTGLASVSCTSAADCEATGYGASGEDAEGWNGVSWSAQITPTPAGGYPGVLNSVSCASADFCEAVGDYELESPAQYVPLAEVWNGTSWATQDAPVLKEAYGSGLQSVWCSSPGSCTAVGYYSTLRSVGEFTLAMVWNGTSWVNQSTPRPAGGKAGNTVLYGVSCAAPRDCTAVGSYPDASGIRQTLAEAGD